MLPFLNLSTTSVPHRSSDGGSLLPLLLKWLKTAKVLLCLRGFLSGLTGWIPTGRVEFSFPRLLKLEGIRQPVLLPLPSDYHLKWEPRSFSIKGSPAELFGSFEPHLSPVTSLELRWSSKQVP